MTLAKDALTHRHALFRHRKQRVSIGTLVTHSLFPAVRRAPVPRPPVFVVTLPVERAFAADRDVPLFKGVDERRVVEHLDTFPTREHNGQVVFRVLTEFDGG